jgi:uncharacterized protein with GYD domain
MAKYIVLFNWTDQGIRNYRESPERAEQFNEAVAQSGVQLTDIWWTSGQYDLVGLLEAPNGEALSAVLLQLGALGNVRTTTMRAFTADEFRGIIGQTG